MKTRREALEYGLSFADTYQEAPFHDDNWQLVRYKPNRKAFLWSYEKDCHVCLNLKAEPMRAHFWRSMYKAVRPGYHQNKEHWNTVILDGTIPDEDVRMMIAESYDLISDCPAKRIYDAVKQIPYGRVATYGQIAALAGDRKMARAVGNALHRNPDPVSIPCYRVVNAAGQLAEAFVFGGVNRQEQLLAEEGVVTVKGKVDLARYGWRRKLFFTDLDETLLTTGKTISPVTYEALRHFAERGNSLVLASGRSLHSVLSVQKALKVDFPRSFILASNGCLIYDCDREETIFRAGVPIAIVKEIFAMAEEHGVYVQTYTDDRILAPRECGEQRYYANFIKTPFIIDTDPVKYLDRPPCKMLCNELHDHEKQERFRAAVMKRFGDEIDTMYSSPYYLEIIPKGCGKGPAAMYLADHLGVPVADTAAAGDEENDNSMIEAAGLGIAMCNGNERTKAVADVITNADNNHDGLAEFLDRL